MNAATPFPMPANEPAAIRSLLHRRQRRTVVVLAGLALVLCAAFGFALAYGDFPVSPGELLTSLLSPLTGLANKRVDFIVLNVRLPRAGAAVFAGIAFGLSGAIFQTLLRNPLASPDIIGITSGASAAAVVCIVVLSWGGLAVSLGAFAGALVTALAIYLLAWRQGVTAYRVVLVGIAMAAILSSVISYVFTRARIEVVQKAMAWLVGSLNGMTSGQLWPLVAALAVLLPATLALARPLRSLELGDDAARGLGTRVELARLGLIVVAVALSAFATAATGPVAFIAFVAGPIARRLLGPSPGVFIAAPLVGSVVMLVSDQLAQHLLPATQLPVGVVTGAFGALFLIYLLIGANRSGSGG